MSDPHTHPHRPEVVIPPLLGRAGVFQGAKTFHLFAQLEDDNGVFVPPDVGALIQGVGWNAPYLAQTPGECGDGLEPRRHKCERLWRVSTAAQVVYRQSQVALPALTPGGMDAFEFPNADPLPAVGGTMGGNGWFRLWVQASDSTGNRRFFMDLDETLELYAFDIKTNVVGPPQAILITDANKPDSTTPVTLNGTLIDLRVGASIQPIESPIGIFETRFTQLIPVAANTQVTVPVPRFARRVKIFADTAGAGPGAWLRQATSTAAAFNVGQINFTNRVSDDRDAELGRESFLLTDLDALARMFVVQWTIAL